MVRRNTKAAQAAAAAEAAAEATTHAAAAAEAGQAPEADEEAPRPRRMADVLRAARVGYEATTASSGKHSLHNGDPIAKALAGATPAQTIAAAQALLGEPSETVPDLAAKYERLNPGQQRMCAGNKIRGGLKRGDWHTEQALAAIAAA